MNEVIVKSNFLTANDIQLLVEKMNLEENTIQHSLKELNSQLRTVEIVVAVIGLGGVFVGALINGLFSLVSTKNNRKIVLEGKSGWRIEVPSSTPAEELKVLIRLSQELDITTIEVEEKLDLKILKDIQK